MRAGCSTRFGWTGLVTDDSRIFVVRGVNIVAIDWDRERTLPAALAAKARQRTAREESWRVHFETYGVIGGLRRWRLGRQMAAEYMRHQRAVASRRGRGL